tara:strand:+ start:64 stop:1620 length:1557 start_codon:yes stop_codon:yes gene_type:complete
MISKLKNTQFNFLFLGISAAMPSFALGLPFGLWLLSADVSKETLGLVTVSSLIVALNFLWSPFVNKLKIPFLYRLLGLRRSWLLLSQIVLGFLLLSLSFINPKDELVLVVILACLIYFFSSVQDIALDAYRVEYDKYFDAENLATIYQIGYKVGAFLIGAQVYNLIGADNWSLIYLYLAFLMFALPLITLLSQRVDELKSNQSTFSQFLYAFRELLQKKNVITLLVLIGIYKISDIVLGPMAASLYTEVGLNKPDFLAQKSYFNFAATFVGSGLALWSIKRLKINFSMFLGAIIVLCSNVLFSFLFLYPTFTNFIAINFLDTIAQAFTAVCFITFLVGLVDRRFTAIQYAFLASLVIIPGTLMKGSSGFIADAYGFYNFFMIMGFLGVPAVCLSYLLYKDELRWNANNSLKVLSIALALIISLLSLIDSGESAMQFNDKFIHFSIYAILAYITLIASKETNIFVLLAIILLLGISLEFAQLITGLRNFEYMDIIANSLGVFGGFTFYYFQRKNLKKSS